MWSIYQGTGEGNMKFADVKVSKMIPKKTKMKDSGQMTKPVKV